MEFEENLSKLSFLARLSGFKFFYNRDWKDRLLKLWFFILVASHFSAAACYLHYICLNHNEEAIRSFSTGFHVFSVMVRLVVFYFQREKFGDVVFDLTLLTQEGLMNGI